MVDCRAEPLPILFYAVLAPRRSAGRRGRRVVMVLVAAVLGVAAFGFLAAGAWPVVGFCGLEVGLLYGALRLHGRTARHTETLSLTRRSLRVCRTGPGGGQTWTFPPYWLRVELADPPAGGPLILRSHGRSLVIGAFLSEDERRAVAKRLVEALAPLSGIAKIAQTAAHAADASGRPASVRSA
jgi:uncharacterized membrane protein